MLVCQNQFQGTLCNTQNRNNMHHCYRCGSHLRFALQLQDPGTLIASYCVVRVIGYGAFGAVYEVEDIKHSGVPMALKETFDPNMIQSFQREFGVLTRLRHPNLPLYHEMFEAHGNGYLVMEFVPGQNLEDVLQRQQRPLMEKLVLFYADQLCDVLSYLHSQHPPIIHRDIKPANVRLTPEGLIKLVDFGLVKQGTQQHLSTIRGGTPLYMALEQWSGGSDPRSDIYSLGATLYHLLAGCTNPPVPVTDRIATTPDPLPSLHRFNPSLSPHIVDAIMKAMALQQQNRYPNVQIFQQALRELNPIPHGSATGTTITINSRNLRTLPTPKPAPIFSKLPDAPSNPPNNPTHFPKNPHASSEHQWESVYWIIYYCVVVPIIGLVTASYWGVGGFFLGLAAGVFLISWVVAVPIFLVGKLIYYMTHID